MKPKKILYMILGLVLLGVAFRYGLPFSVTGVATVYGTADYQDGKFKVAYALTSINDKFDLIAAKGFKDSKNATHDIETTIEAHVELSQNRYYSKSSLFRPTTFIQVPTGKGTITVNEKELSPWLSFVDYSYLITGARQYGGTSTIGIGKDRSTTIGDIFIENLGFLSYGINVPDSSFYAVNTLDGYAIYDRSAFRDAVEGTAFMEKQWGAWLFWCGKAFYTYSWSEIYRGAEKSLLAFSCSNWAGLDDILTDYKVQWTQTAGITKVSVYDTEVVIDHPVYGATGSLVIWFPEDFLGARIIERIPDVKPDITDVSKSRFELESGQSTSLIVRVKNTGKDSGVISVVPSLDGFVFGGETEKRVSPGSSEEWSFTVTALATSKTTEAEGRIRASAVGGSDSWGISGKNTFKEPLGDKDGDGIPDNIDKCPTEKETFNNYQDTDGCPDKSPETEDIKGVLLTSTKITFKGDNFFTGSITALGLERYNIEGTKGSSLKELVRERKVRAIEYSEGISNWQSFNLVTSDTDSDAYFYSFLMRVSFESKNPVNVYKNGKLIAGDVKEFHYTNPIVYLPLLILVAVAGIGYILYKKR